MRYLVKTEKPSAWARIRDFFSGSEAWYEADQHAAYRAASNTQVTAEWHPSSGSADDALLGVIGSLRDRSRDLDRNEGLARGAIENYVTNVVSDGLRPQSKLDHELLGIPEPAAREFERRAEKIFALHTGQESIDFHAQSNLTGLEAQILRSVLLDGDCLVISRYSERQGSILPITLQVIEGGRLRNPLLSDFKADIREGVEFDLAGRPVAYHVIKAGKDRFLGSDTIRVPKYLTDGVVMALHVFDQRLPGQSRGEPFLAPVIAKFKQISRYSDAEIDAAVINAYFSAFFVSEMGGVFDNRQTAHFGKSMSAIVEKDQPQRKTHKFGPGTIFELLPGEKITSSAPGRPNSNFDPFVQAVIKQIGIGLGLPYEVLTQHFQSSYSASRAAILEAWKAFRVRRAWLVTRFCQPVWEWIITEAINQGLLDAPGFDDPFKRKLYLSAQWTGTEMESIDPLKEARANEIEISSGIKSRRFIVESQGRDFDKHQREFEEERKVFSKSEEGAQDTQVF